MSAIHSKSDIAAEMQHEISRMAARHRALLDEFERRLRALEQSTRAVAVAAHRLG